ERQARKQWAHCPHLTGFLCVFSLPLSLSTNAGYLPTQPCARKTSIASPSTPLEDNLHIQDSAEGGLQPAAYDAQPSAPSASWCRACDVGMASRIGRASTFLHPSLTRGCDSEHSEDCAISERQSPAQRRPLRELLGSKT